MSNRRRAKKLIASVTVIVLALALLIFGEGISDALERVTEIPSLSKFPRIFYSAPKDGEVQIHVIDVDQADSILIRSRDTNILIDAGTNDSEAALKAYLDACKVKKIDYLICTHPHYDHIGGADMVIERYDVKKVLMTYMDDDSTTFDMLLESIDRYDIAAEIPKTGAEYTIGELSFKILAPLEVSDDGNEMSLIVKLTHGDMDFIFMGDAGEAAEKLLLEAYSESELDCEFLKVGHHGSETASSAEFLSAVSVQIAAISCGEYNEYGHPRGEVLARLADSGCDTILRTDKMGTVVVSSDGSSLTVISE